MTEENYPVNVKRLVFIKFPDSSNTVDRSWQYRPLNIFSDTDNSVWLWRCSLNLINARVLGDSLPNFLEITYLRATDPRKKQPWGSSLSPGSGIPSRMVRHGHPGVETARFSGPCLFCCCLWYLQVQSTAWRANSSHRNSWTPSDTGRNVEKPEFWPHWCVQFLRKVLGMWPLDAKSGTWGSFSPGLSRLGLLSSSLKFSNHEYITNKNIWWVFKF